MNDNAKTSYEEELNRYKEKINLIFDAMNIKLDALAVALAWLAKGRTDKMLDVLEKAWKEEEP